MKKKVLIPMALVALLCVGCGSKKETTTQVSVDTTDKTSIEATVEATEEVTETETTEDVKKEKSLQGLAEYLVAGNYVTGEQTEPMYTYISAIGGFKYLDSDVEVYEYDESSDVYKSILETNSVSGLPVAAVNGPFVLIFSNNNVNQTVVDAFNNY